MDRHLKQIESLIGVDDEAALKLAKSEWVATKDAIPLDDDAVRLLALIGSLLHGTGDDKEALGYLSRFHLEFANQSSSSGISIVLEWADLLYESVADSVKAELNLRHRDADNCDDLVREEWLRLASTQAAVKATARISPALAQRSTGCSSM